MISFALVVHKPYNNDTSGLNAWKMQKAGDLVKLSIILKKTYNSHVATIIPASCLHQTWYLARLCSLAVPYVWIQLDDIASIWFLTGFLSSSVKAWSKDMSLSSLWFLTGLFFLSEHILVSSIASGHMIPRWFPVLIGVGLIQSYSGIGRALYMNLARCQRAYIRFFFISFLFSFAKDPSKYIPELAAPCEMSSMPMSISFLTVSYSRRQRPCMWI